MPGTTSKTTVLELGTDKSGRRSSYRGGGRIHMLIGTLGRPSLARLASSDLPTGRRLTQQHSGGLLLSPSSNTTLGLYQSNYVSITRELAFGAHVDGSDGQERKPNSEYRYTCLGRIVFALIVLAFAVGVFVLRMFQFQQDLHLREQWKAGALPTETTLIPGYTVHKNFP